MLLLTAVSVRSVSLVERLTDSGPAISRGLPLDERAALESSPLKSLPTLAVAALARSLGFPGDAALSFFAP